MSIRWRSCSTVSTIYVANNSDDSVTVYPPDSDHPSRDLLRGVQRPSSLALDGHGNLFVGNTGSASVTVYGPKSTRPIQTLCPGAAHPVSLQFDPLGSLYVANALARKVGIFPAIKR